MHELPAILQTRQFCEPVLYEQIILAGEMAPVLHHLFCNLNSFPCRRWEVYLVDEEFPPSAETERFMALTVQGIIKRIYDKRPSSWRSAHGSDVL